MVRDELTGCRRRGEMSPCYSAQARATARRPVLQRAAPCIRAPARGNNKFGYKRLRNGVGNVDWTTWLLETGSVSAEQLEDAVRLAGLRSMPLPYALLSLGYAEPSDITRAFAAQ